MDDTPRSPFFQGIGQFRHEPLLQAGHIGLVLLELCSGKLAGSPEPNNTRHILCASSKAILLFSPAVNQRRNGGHILYIQSAHTFRAVDFMGGH